MKLKYKYPGKETELMVCVERLLKLSMMLEVNKEYSLEYLSARIGIKDMEMVRDALFWISEAGFITIGKGGEYYVLDN
jgi:hypothetical protein